MTREKLESSSRGGRLGGGGGGGGGVRSSISESSSKQTCRIEEEWNKRTTKMTNPDPKNNNIGCCNHTRNVESLSPIKPNLARYTQKRGVFLDYIQTD